MKRICVLFGVLFTSPNNCSRARPTCYTCTLWWRKSYLKVHVRFERDFTGNIEQNILKHYAWIMRFQVYMSALKHYFFKIKPRVFYFCLWFISYVIMTWEISGYHLQNVTLLHYFSDLTILIFQNIYTVYNSSKHFINKRKC